MVLKAAVAWLSGSGPSQMATWKANQKIMPIRQTWLLRSTMSDWLMQIASAQMVRLWVCLWRMRSASWSDLPIGWSHDLEVESVVVMEML